MNTPNEHAGKSSTVQFTFPADTAAALDCYAKHDNRTRPELIRAILFAQLVRCPASLHVVAFDPERSIEQWVAGRTRGEFLPSRDDAPLLPRPAKPDVTVRVSLRPDMAAALRAHANYTLGWREKASSALRAIVRSWLILCPREFILPTFPKDVTLEAWVVLSIDNAKRKGGFGDLIFGLN